MPLECGIIFDGIPEGAISRKVGLIWGIPVKVYLCVGGVCRFWPTQQWIVRGLGSADASYTNSDTAPRT